MRKLKKTFAAVLLLAACSLSFGYFKFSASDAAPSFKYGGIEFDENSWKKNSEFLREDSCEKVSRNTYTSPDGLLKVYITIREFKNFPVVEWLPGLENVGNFDTQIVENFDTLKISAKHTSEIGVRKYAGARGEKIDFVCQPEILKKPLTGAKSSILEIGEKQGRSSSVWMPFVGLDFDELNGLNIAVGWSGSWKMKFVSDGKNLEINSGMQKTHFKLFPKEKIRMPSMFVMNRVNTSVEDAQNIHRRFMLAHHSPKDASGNTMRAPLCFTTSGSASEKMCLQMIEKISAHKMKYDVFSMDAGWYGPAEDRPFSLYKFGWWALVGDWRVNKKIYPNGFAPISNAAHEAGMKTMLWFEIERVSNSDLKNSRPDLIFPDEIRKGAKKRPTLNYGKPDAVKWAADTVSGVMKEGKIDCYRQDYNMNPGEYWDAADAPDRIGVSEAKHIAGLYEFWRCLRERFPGLLIDNCAGGGRRIDFESLSYSMPLWRSDYQCKEHLDFSPENHSQIYYITQWVPLHSGGIPGKEKDDYGWASGISSGMMRLSTFSEPFCKDDFPVEEETIILEKIRRMSDMFLCDFYPLSKNPENEKNWYAYQMHSPEKGEGFIAAFRRENSERQSQIFSPRKIDENASYEIETYAGEKKKISGKELAQFKLNLTPRTFEVLFYKKL